MDFSAVTNETAKNVYAVIGRILVLNISPADKRAQIARVIGVVGQDYYIQLYGAASEVFDAGVISTNGIPPSDTRADRLASKIVRNDALGRNTARDLVAEYYNTTLGQAQHEAFQNARSLQKNPTLTRSLGPKKDCDWCIEKSGTHVNPTPDLFARHDRCDCVFVVSGYNTRNGVLKNYRKR